MREGITMISMSFSLLLHLVGDWWNDISITGTVRPQIAPLGHPVTLSCEVRGCTSSSPQVILTKWEDSQNQTLYMHGRSQKHMENDTVIFKEFKNGLLQVILPQVQLASSGQYVCGMQCDDIYKEAILEVTVEGVINAAVLGVAIFPCLLTESHDPSYLKLQWKKISPGKSHTIASYLYLASCPVFYPEHVFGERPTCSNRSSPRIWLRKNYEHRMEVPRDDLFGRANASLKLRNVQVEDAGKYKCSVESNMLRKVVIFSLSVKAPSVIATAKPKTVRPGYPMTLSCQIQNCDSSKLLMHLYKREDSRNQTLFMHNSAKQHNDQKRSREEGGEDDGHASNPIVKEYKNGVLLVTFPKVQRASSGQYVCAVQCDDVHKDAVIEVIVEEIQDTEKWMGLFLLIICLPILSFPAVATWYFLQRKAQVETGEKIRQLSIKIEEHKKLLNEIEKCKTFHNENGDSEATLEELKKLQSEVEELKKLRTEVAWRRARDDADTITLDPDSAHPCISINYDKKSFTHETEIRPVLPNPQSFDGIVAVLGSEGFSSGNHYWEVDTGGSCDWDVGVARKSIKRKGNITLSPQEGFWVLGFTRKDYFAKTDPWTRITVQGKPSKICVHLSFQEKKVTFYNDTDKSVLFQFKACEFLEDIYPFFKNADKGTTMDLFT